MPLFKKDAFLDKEQAATVVAAIRNAETKTSGEIRVYLETKNKLVSSMDRAKEVFIELKMHKTELRNGVLIYAATQHKEICILADKGIFEAAPDHTWNQAVSILQTQFAKNNYVEGLVGAVEYIGNYLVQFFPFNSETDKNELPDEIIFGK